ncbi:OmpH family outer membrane protein [Saprospira grandis]|nr:OmpH family outer membrane protein [Saprospira grandis]WBM74980.1 OmpH family outer membrane protein [Saprospira grandis]
MKNLLLSLTLLLSSMSFSFAQRAAYVDMTKIMDAVPEYKTAQAELDQLAERWRQEIAKEYEQIEQLYREYQAREVLMSEEMKTQKQNEIIEKEKAVRALQDQRFGPEGELFSKRQSLVKPIQEKVYKTIELLAKERNYDFIFTAPDGSQMIYAKADKDLTAEVVKRLGK